MQRPALLAMLALAITSSGCDMAKIAVGTTSKALVRAQPAMKQEADYVLASRAIPGAIKTVEGFHMVDPENERLTGILAEGYCQYATGFIEDEWELAVIAGDTEAAELHSDRAVKSFLRCMGYGLELLGGPWKERILGDLEGVKTLLPGVDEDSRDALMWTAIGLAGAINQSKDDPAMLAHISKAKAMLERVVAIDDAKGKSDKALRAMPHLALGMLHSSIPPALGGQPEVGRKHFERAVELTDGKFLLAKVYFARRYAVITQNRDLFQNTLVEVLRTDPAIWPDQRLANEIAHRRAHRYLNQEKEWF